MYYKKALPKGGAFYFGGKLIVVLNEPYKGLCIYKNPHSIYCLKSSNGSLKSGLILKIPFIHPALG